jgi:peptide/nickel transport system substrate-binding protein
MNNRYRRLVAVVASIATVGALAACAPATASNPTSLTIAIPPPGLLLDGDASPFHGRGITDTLTWMPVYEGLLVWDPIASGWDPWLATEYTIDDDRLSMVITLRDDVDFVDGAHLDAAGLATYLTELYADPAFTRPEPVLVPEFAATGEYTLEVSTRAPITNVFFEGLMSATPIVSPEAIADRESLVTEPVGSGPYTLDEHTLGVSMSFVRNPNYWNPDAFDFDTITLRVFEDGVAALNALKSGQVDISPILPNMADEAESSGFRISSSANGYVGVWMTDVTGSIVPALGEVRVRRAIAMALDQAAIIDAVDHGWGEPGSQVFAPGQLEYVEGGDDRYSYDLDAAKALMAEAGYADGFEVTMPRLPGFVPEEYVPAVEQALGDLGITVSYQAYADIGELIGAWAAHEVAMFILIANYNLVTRGGVSGAGALFPQLTEDPGFAELKQIEDFGTLEESVAASADIGEYVLDQAWIAPITQKVQLWASIPSVSYLLNNLDGLLQLRNFTLVD